MPGRLVFGRTVYARCPRCGEMVFVNWNRSKSAAKTIEVWVHPGNNRAVEVAFTCSECGYRVSLGSDRRPYGLPD